MEKLVKVLGAYNSSTKFKTYVDNKSKEQHGRSYKLLGFAIQRCVYMHINRFCIYYKLCIKFQVYQYENVIAENLGAMGHH
jgi:hypothetical protein